MATVMGAATLTLAGEGKVKGTLSAETGAAVQFAGPIDVAKRLKFNISSRFC